MNEPCRFKGKYLLRNEGAALPLGGRDVAEGKPLPKKRPAKYAKQISRRREMTFGSVRSHRIRRGKRKTTRRIAKLECGSEKPGKIKKKQPPKKKV